MSRPTNIPTPRTDAVWSDVLDFKGTYAIYNANEKYIEHARELERENVVLRGRIEQAKQGLQSLHSDAVKYPQLKMHANQLEHLMGIIEALTSPTTI